MRSAKATRLGSASARRRSGESKNGVKILGQHGEDDGVDAGGPAPHR